MSLSVSKRSKTVYAGLRGHCATEQLCPYVYLKKLTRHTHCCLHPTASLTSGREEATLRASNMRKARARERGRHDERVSIQINRRSRLTLRASSLATSLLPRPESFAFLFSRLFRTSDSSREEISAQYKEPTHTDVFCARGLRELRLHDTTYDQRSRTTRQRELNSAMFAATLGTRLTVLQARAGANEGVAPSRAARGASLFARPHTTLRGN